MTTKKATTQFTAGPWIAVETNYAGMTDLQANGKHVARISDGTRNRAANACIIAQAPTMLEALRLTLGNLRSLKNNAFRQFDTIDGWIDEVEKAISAAEGVPS